MVASNKLVHKRQERTGSHFTLLHRLCWFWFNLAAIPAGHEHMQELATIRCYKTFMKWERSIKLLMKQLVSSFTQIIISAFS